MSRATTRRAKARPTQRRQDNKRGEDLTTGKRRGRQRLRSTTANRLRPNPAPEKVPSKNDLSDPSVEGTNNPPVFDPQPVIPDNTSPEAKVAISQLVAINCQQESRIQTLQVENSVLKDRVGRSESRVRVLTSMLKVVMAAMQ